MANSWFTPKHPELATKEGRVRADSYVQNHYCNWLGNTYIEAEELAYNTPTGSHSRSERKGRVRFPDYSIRSVTLGIPDTYFTIPAHARIRGKYTPGYVSVDTDRNEYVFHPIIKA